MTGLDWLEPGRTAVITGAADGVGRAAALKFAGLGLNVVMADRNAEGLARSAEMARGLVQGGAVVDTFVLDVADAQQVLALKHHAFDRFGDVAVLMNNAGIGGGGGPFGPPEAWARVLAVNLWGVIHGVQAFGEAMIAQDRPAAIINTGSKQGITTPPGDTAYNVSKAGVKVLTEALEHSLRTANGGKVRAHLLIPGFTFTGITRPAGTDKPPGAWTADQVIAFALERMAAGDFYILCPDNEVTRDMDNARITWAAQDITQNRPPLSRWHADWKDAFAAFMAAREGAGE
jgi:NAD(P)-dependent dehydrogenase (short-subunit alcohol dehydrogenase family)